MKKNTAVSIGALALIEKVNDEFQLFPSIFKGLGGRAKNLIQRTLQKYDDLTCF